MSEYKKITTERAKQLGKMMASFKDSDSYPVSFNATCFYVNCFGYTCELLIKDNAGCWYREFRK